MRTGQLFSRSGGVKKVTVTLVSAIVVAASLSLTPASAAVPNPDLPQECDVDIALILDASGSIARFKAVDDIRQLGVGLIAGVAGRGPRLSIAEFATFSDPVIPTMPVDRSTAGEVFEPYFTGEGSPAYYDGRVGTFTNWEDGFRDVAAQPSAPDVVLFVSDGVPNTVGDDATAIPGNGGGPEAATAAAAVYADQLKSSGTDVISIGVGGLNDGTGVQLLRSVSGPDNIREVGVGLGDYFIGNFSELPGLLDQILRALCGGTTVVESLLDVDGDLATTEDRVPMEGIPIITAGSDRLSQSSPVTDANGSVTVSASWGGESSIELDLIQPPPSGHDVVASYCTGVDVDVAGSGFSERHLVVGRTNIVNCTFLNVERPAALGFELEVEHIDDVDGSSDTSIGDVIHYRATATNVGGATLDNVQIRSDLLNWTRCEPEQGSVLTPDETLVCWGAHVIEPDEALTGIRHNVSAGAEQVGSLFDTEVTLIPAAGLAFDKQIIRTDDRDGSGDLSIDDIVHYRLEASNVGEANLTNVEIIDPMLDTMTCSPANGTALVPGQRLVCEGTISVATDHLGAQLVNTAVATSDQIGPVVDSARIAVPQPQAQLSTTITHYDDLDGNDSPSRGDRVHILNVGANTGPSNLSELTIADDLSQTMECDSASSELPIGGRRLCDGTYMVVIDDHGTDLVVHGEMTTRQLPSLVDSDLLPIPSAELRVVGVLDELIDEDGSGGPSPGDRALFRFTAGNVGEMTLTDVEFQISGVTDVVCTPHDASRLAVGDVIDCTGQRLITESDEGATLIASGQATSSQTLPAGDEVELTVEADQRQDDRPEAACGDGALFFGQEHLLAGESSESRPAILTHGRYRVTLVSYDKNHRPGYQTTQTAEVWMVEFLNADGDVVARSSVTADLAETDRIDRYVVDENLVLPSGVVAVRARNGATGGVNSIAPLCAEIVQLEAFEEPDDPDGPASLECAAGDVDLGAVLLMGRDGFRSVDVDYALEPGTYDVSAVSEDVGHALGHQPGQTMEQWRIDFVSADGRVIASTGYTDDLEEGATRNRSNLGRTELIEPTTTLRLVHREDARLDSIHPVCARIRNV